MQKGLKMERPKPKTIENNYASPRLSGEILDCALPMSFDQYSRCSMDCLYCFSYFQRILSIHHKSSDPKMAIPYNQRPPSSVNVDKIIDMFTGKRKTAFSALIARRNPFQWGGLSDPFDMFEKQYGVGLEILKVLHKMKYPICFSTKGTWILDDDRYAQLFHNNSFWNVKVSIINLDAEKAKLMERGVSSPSDRILFMRKLVKLQGPNGGGVTLRLRPFIIGYTNENNAHVELIQAATQAGATAVTTEFLCIDAMKTDEHTQKRYNDMSAIIGIDIMDFYKKNTVSPVGYMRLNWKIKEKYINEMQAACKIRFYVSDAHHKDRSCNGCCCGLPESWTYHRGQYTNALLIAKKKGWVAWSDIENDIFPEYAEQGIVQACGLNLGRKTAASRARFKNITIKEYFKIMWNDPSKNYSPYKYFYGLLKPLKLDNNKNIIYQYTPYK